jgi:hypothetical protein
VPPRAPLSGTSARSWRGPPGTPPRAAAMPRPPRSPSRWPSSASPTSGARPGQALMTAPAWSTPRPDTGFPGRGVVVSIFPERDGEPSYHFEAGSDQRRQLPGPGINVRVGDHVLDQLGSRVHDGLDETVAPGQAQGLPDQGGCLGRGPADGDARAQQPQFQIGPDHGSLSRGAAQGLGRLFGVPGGQSNDRRHDDAPVSGQPPGDACGSFLVAEIGRRCCTWSRRRRTTRAPRRVTCRAPRPRPRRASRQEALPAGQLGLHHGGRAGADQHPGLQRRSQDHGEPRGHAVYLLLPLRRLLRRLGPPPGPDVPDRDHDQDEPEHDLHRQRRQRRRRGRLGRVVAWSARAARGTGPPAARCTPAPSAGRSAARSSCRPGRSAGASARKPRTRRPHDDHLVGVGVDPGPEPGQQRLALAGPDHGVDLHGLMDPAGRFRVDENGGAHVARRRRFGLALRDRPLD